MPLYYLTATKTRDVFPSSRLLASLRLTSLYSRGGGTYIPSFTVLKINTIAYTKNIPAFSSRTGNTSTLLYLLLSPGSFPPLASRNSLQRIIHSKCLSLRHVLCEVHTNRYALDYPPYDPHHLRIYHYNSDNTNMYQIFGSSQVCLKLPPCYTRNSFVRLCNHKILLKPFYFFYTFANLNEIYTWHDYLCI